MKYKRKKSSTALKYEGINEKIKTNTSIVLAKERIDKKGTEDNRFIMNHAFEIDVNLLKTSGVSVVVTTF